MSSAAVMISALRVNILPMLFDSFGRTQTYFSDSSLKENLLLLLTFTHLCPVSHKQTFVNIIDPAQQMDAAADLRSISIT